MQMQPLSDGVSLQYSPGLRNAESGPLVTANANPWILRFLKKTRRFFYLTSDFFSFINAICFRLEIPLSEDTHCLRI
jgi:hypothetical protein